MGSPMGILGIQDMKCMRIREIVQRTGREETGKLQQSAGVLDIRTGLRPLGYPFIQHNKIKILLR